PHDLLDQRQTIHRDSSCGTPRRIGSTWSLVTMDSITLTKTQARKIILHAAGLSKRAQFGKGKEAVYKFIDHLGFIQIDTNYVVERAHHHSIASRVPDYKM